MIISMPDKERRLYGFGGSMFCPAEPAMTGNGGSGDDVFIPDKAR